MEELQKDSLNNANLDDAYSDDTIYPALMGRDQDAWSQFYLHYSPRLRSYFRNRGIVHVNDQEDLLQQTISQVFFSLENFDPQRFPLRNWIYGIAANMLLRHKEQFVEEKQLFIQSEDLENVASESNDDSENIPLDASTKTVLENALAQLSDAEQLIIQIRLEREDMWTWASIAQELGIKESAAKMRHKRALAKLRNILAGA